MALDPRIPPGLGRRHLATLLLVGVSTALAFVLLDQRVFGPALTVEGHEAVGLRLESRAQPMMARMGRVGERVERLGEDLARADAPDAQWSTRATEFLRTSHTVDRVVAMLAGGSTLPALERVGRTVETAESRDGFERVVASYGDVGQMAGESVVDVPFCIEDDASGRPAHAWVLRTSHDGRVLVGARIRAGICDVGLASLHARRGTAATVRDGHGHELVRLGDPRTATVFEDVDFASMMHEGPGRGPVRTIDVEGVGPVFVALRMDPELGVAIGHAIPRAEALATYDGMLRAAMAAFVAILLGAGLVLWRMRAVVHVLARRTVASMQGVARGDLSQRLPVRGPREYSEVARAYNTMLSDLHTSHVAMRRQNEDLADTLRAVEDVESMKDSFLALVSHEVRTPLTSIMGGVEFLREEFQDGRSEIETEFIEIVFDSAKRLSGFMNDAILMASLQANKSRSDFELFSLTGLLQGKVESMASKCASRNVELESRVDAQRELFVRGDWTLMQVALEKVLDNALQHNVDDGRIVVEWVERVLEDPDGDLRRMMAARTVDLPDDAMDWWALRVFNTGPVIPPDKIGQIFARFELTHDIDNHQRGSGLSLPIASYVLGFHGGGIEVRAVDEAGMAFYLVIPARLGVQPRRSDETPAGVDETVAAAHMVESSVADSEALMSGGSEEVLVGDDPGVESAQPQSTGEGIDAGVDSKVTLDA